MVWQLITQRCILFIIFTIFLIDSVRRHHRPGHPGRRRPQRNHLAAQPERPPRHGRRSRCTRFPATLVLLLDDALHFDGVSADLPDRAQQGAEGE